MMTMDRTTDTGAVTRLLVAARAGDAHALDRIVPLLYEDLRRLARAQVRRAGTPTMHPTELVHEAYMKLVVGGAAAAVDRGHFLSIAARAMRQVMVDHARLRGAAKRGAGWERATLSGVGWSAEFAPEELLALNDAMERLDARQRQVVECRFFGGMEESEIAAVLGVTVRTVRRDWVKARAWLYKELGERAP